MEEGIRNKDGVHLRLLKNFLLPALLCGLCISAFCFIPFAVKKIFTSLPFRHFPVILLP
jgi:hypothetical protein